MDMQKRTNPSVGGKNLHPHLTGGCVLLQRSQGCRGELPERSGPAAGGRAQLGGADEAQTGARQSAHGEPGTDSSDYPVSALTRTLKCFSWAQVTLQQ